MGRLVLYAGLLVVAVLLISIWARGSRARRRTTSGQPDDIMVCDPVCSLYLPKSRAVARQTRGATMYFCSDACADQYESKEQESEST